MKSLLLPSQAPPELPLLQYGRHCYTKNGKEGEFFFDESDADKIISEFKKRGKDLVFDYEHQTLTGNEAPAGGWITVLEKTPMGLVGKKLEWTDKAKNYIKNKEYRYFSPVLDFATIKNQLHPVSMHSFAITNHPAIHDGNARVRLAAKDKANLMGLDDTMDAYESAIIAIKDRIDRLHIERVSLGDMKQNYAIRQQAKRDWEERFNAKRDEMKLKKEQEKLYHWLKAMGKYTVPVGSYVVINAIRKFNTIDNFKKNGGDEYLTTIINNKKDEARADVLASLEAGEIFSPMAMRWLSPNERMLANQERAKLIEKIAADRDAKSSFSDVLLFISENISPFADKSKKYGETKYIKKRGNKWCVISSKTGKPWKSRYDSAELAHKALSAYHAQEKMNDLNKVQKKIEQLNEKMFNDIAIYEAFLAKNIDDKNVRLNEFTDKLFFSDITDRADAVVVNQDVNDALNSLSLLRDYPDITNDDIVYIDRLINKIQKRQESIAEQA